MLRVILLMLSILSFQVMAKEIPAADFARHNQFKQVKISPDGKYIAATIVLNGETVLSMIRLSDRVGKNLHAGSGREVLDFDWVNDHRVVYSVAYRIGWLEQPVATGELFGVEAESGNGEVLFGFEAGSVSNSATAIKHVEAERGSAQLLDYHSPDPNFALVAVTPWNDSATYGDGSFTTVYRMDVRTGVKSQVITGPLRNASFLVDHDGVVRFSWGVTGENLEQVYYRSDANSKWELIGDEKKSNDARPLLFNRGGTGVYFICGGHDRPNRICLWDVQTRKFTTVASNPVADMHGVVLSNDEKDIVAVRFMPGRPSLVLLDSNAPEVKELSNLMQTFPGQEVILGTRTRDGSKTIVIVQSDTNPGEFYLLDNATNKMEFLAKRRSWVKSEQMATMQPIELKARDGLVLHGYMTRPPGKEEEKNLPLVVVPHGGPFGIRDSWGYESDVQLLANHGYAVLQVNYRGSGGYGYDFFRAGWREWGGKMQDDVTDATHWAIDQGIADGKRVCIYGGSYGGYAALMGVEKEPDLYRCAIGYAGVYNLKLESVRSDTARSSAGNSYFKRQVGDSEADLLERSPITHVNDIKAAVMLVHGTDDARVPIANAEQLRTALDKRHVPYEWLSKRGEGHGFYDEKNIAEFYEKMLAFLDKNIGSASATGEKSTEHK